MAKGDIYDVSRYCWQVRENTSGGVFIRYDNDISASNKGRYNTSEIVAAESNGGMLKFTTKSGSVYYFSQSKCVYPMHLLALQMRFGVEVQT